MLLLSSMKVADEEEVALSLWGSMFACLSPWCCWFDCYLCIQNGCLTCCCCCGSSSAEFCCYPLKLGSHIAILPLSFLESFSVAISASCFYLILVDAGPLVNYEVTRPWFYYFMLLSFMFGVWNVCFLLSGAYAELELILGCWSTVVTEYCLFFSSIYAYGLCSLVIWPGYSVFTLLITGKEVTLFYYGFKPGDY